MSKDVSKNIVKEYKQLLSEINKHRKAFHSGTKEKISAELLDSLKKRLQDLELQYPELKDKHSPTDTIEAGTKLDKFQKVTHKVKQWSFNDVFTDDEIRSFDENVKKKVGDVEYFCEYKIDGVKVVIEYENGKLKTAATRGDGVVGEDVTEHIKTVQDVPHEIKEKGNLIIEGEIWLPKKEFERINKDEGMNYANPRNLTAGTLRQLDISIVASRKLRIFFYDLPLYKEQLKTQKDEHDVMEKLGFNLNPKTKLCKDIEEVINFWQSLIDFRDKEEYGVDGIVVKVNSIEAQKVLGHTGKAPRYAIAFKFPAQEAVSKIQNIAFQVGRTGVVTPVAHLDPVDIDGSTVSRATLHNEDNIEKLGIKIGDTVVLRKAGDIIPEIVKVMEDLRTGNEKVFKWPKKIAECGGDGSIERESGKAAWKCVSKDSFAQRLRTISHFTSKGALDIQGFAEKLVKQLLEVGLISNIDDIFTLKKGDLLELPLIKEKKAQNILDGVEKARKTTLSRLLFGLSIDLIGSEASYALSREFKDVDDIFNAEFEKLSAINLIGDERAKSIKNWYADKNNKDTLKRVLKHLDISNSLSNDLDGKAFVITGNFGELKRDEIEETLRSRGATVSGSVSKKTDIVFAGEKAGDKKKKAVKLGVDVQGEEELLKLLGK